MDVLLGPREIRLRDDLRAWAREELRRPAGAGTGFPPAFVEKLALRAKGSGLFSPAADSRGPDLGSALMLEGVSSASAEAGFRLAEHVGLCIPFLLSYGRPEQQERYLPALVAGRTPGRWLGVDADAVESGPDGWLLTARRAPELDGSGPATTVLVAAVKVESSGRALHAFVFDGRDRVRPGRNESEVLLPDSCRMDVGSSGFPGGWAAVRSSSSMLLGCFLGAAAGLLESWYEAGRTRGAFETLILEARDIQVRLSETRVGFETLRWLHYRDLLRRKPGRPAEGSDRLMAETLEFLSGVLDLAGRLEAPDAGPALDARHARALLASLRNILP
jgi:alkylation response protein AidB-like acyl-CoA dehydrogenase